MCLSIYIKIFIKNIKRGKKMLVRANRIFKVIKDKKLQNDNTSTTPRQKKLEIFRLIEFTRKIIELIFTSHSSPTWNKSNDNSMFELFQMLLGSILADIYKVGRCTENADLGIISFLKTGINKGIEIIRVSGEGVDTVNHNFIAIDRNQNNNVKNLASWGNFIKFDPWGNDIAQHDERNIPSLASLCSGQLHCINDISVKWSRTGNLNKKECEKYSF